MKTASAKNKGRSLQKLVAKIILAAFPKLPESDVVSTPMGTQGADIRLSALAHKVLPYKIECKNQEGFGGVYAAYEQALTHKGKGVPLVIIKSNRRRPLAIVDAEYFIYLHKLPKNFETLEEHNGKEQYKDGETVFEAGSTGQDSRDIAKPADED